MYSEVHLPPQSLVMSSQHMRQHTQSCNPSVFYINFRFCLHPLQLPPSALHCHFLSASLNSPANRACCFGPDCKKNTEEKDNRFEKRRALICAVVVFLYSCFLYLICREAVIILIVMLYLVISSLTQGERGGMKRTREEEWERGRGGESGEPRITRELMRCLNTE